MPDWVIEHPESLPVLQTLGIDFSCRGKSLDFTCQQSGRDVRKVLDELREVIDGSPRADGAEVSRRSCPHQESSSTMQETLKIVGHQTSHHLLFAHWWVDASQLQTMLSESLTLETFDGSGWLGVVPISTERVRTW